ncbi:MAG: Protein-arginine kinase [Elusimicrobia bacterium]|nr:Protein-arginine kinase [Elusimicrobiota bacterium]
MSKPSWSSLAQTPLSWLYTNGRPIEKCVFFSKIQLSRNLTGHPFPHHATLAQRKKEFELIWNAIETMSTFSKKKSFSLKSLTPSERQFIFEKQWASQSNLNETSLPEVLVSDSGLMTLSINGNDHVSYSTFGPGLLIKSLWENINEFDDDMGAQLHYSYNTNFGYITSSPTRLGTGLEVSCLLHLPALVFSGKTLKLIESLPQSDYLFSGFSDDGTVALGDLFVVSNGRTLGRTEEEILHGLETLVKEICTFEKSEENTIRETDLSTRLDEQIYRVLGTLRWATSLNLKEGLKLISILRLGHKMGKDVPCSLEKLNQLFFQLQPAHVKFQFGLEDNPNQVDKQRAELLRRELPIK